MYIFIKSFKTYKGNNAYFQGITVDLIGDFNMSNQKKKQVNM